MCSMFKGFILIFFTGSETSPNKLVVAKLFKKFPTIYETRSFMTTFIEVRHWAVFTMKQSNIFQILIYKGTL
jgi:hypothetical protein